MRRVMFTVAATVLMAGVVPATALAHHHHNKHHARHHARIRRFGDQNTPPTSMSPSDNAGKVADFSNGVLTIQLNDGSTVKGAVTNDTELECMAPSQSSTTTHEDGDGGSGDQSSGSGDQSSGSGDQSSGTEDQGDNDQNETQGEDQNQTQGEDQGEDQNQNEANNNCSTSNLTPGTVVHEASLRIGGSGATWQKVELVS